MQTKEEEFEKAFDDWADSSKKLTIAKANYEKVSYPLRRNPKGNELMKEVFNEMHSQISILTDREYALSTKVRDAKEALK